MTTKTKTTKKSAKLPVPKPSAKQQKASAARQTVPLAKLGETDVGKANAKTWEQIPAVKRARAKAKTAQTTETPSTSAEQAADLLAQTNGDGLPEFLVRKPGHKSTPMPPAPVSRETDARKPAPVQPETVVGPSGFGGKTAQRKIAQEAVEQNGDKVRKITPLTTGLHAKPPARSPGYARLQASGKAEKLREDTKAAQDKATKLAPKPKAAAKGESKSATVRAMLSQPNGATRQEIIAAVAWPTIDLKAQAKRANRKLIEREGRYYLK